MPRGVRWVSKFRSSFPGSPVMTIDFSIFLNKLRDAQDVIMAARVRVLPNGLLNHSGHAVAWSLQGAGSAAAAAATSG